MDASSPRVSVVYADDDARFRTTLLHTLLADGTLDVVAVAVDGEAALRAVREHEPDVALLSADTTGLSGLDIAEALAMSTPRPRTRTLLLGAVPFRSPVRAAAAVGSDGVVDRRSSREEIVARVRDAAGATAAT